MKPAPAPARLLLASLALLAGCGPAADEDGPLAVSLIGTAADIAPAMRRPATPASAALLGAVAQGLVRFDAQGQIVAGVAMRWDVSDDGLFYTFRIAEGAAVDAGTIARLLRAAIGRASRNPLKPLLGSIDEVVAVTPEVVEIRLSAPRSDLLELLAQPAFALTARAGGGPFRVADRDGTTLRLTQPAPGRPIRLRVERAALAVVRFADGETRLVEGGSFADLPIVSAADIDVRALRFDPVEGLFGLEVTRAQGLLADPAARRALSAAIDRGRIVALIGAPGRAMPPAPPAVPGRVTAAPPAPLRIAMPAGPGARPLFRLIAADWARIGVAAEMVGAEAEADLRLIDLVAPTDAPDWPIARLGCSARAVPCSAEADAALARARSAAAPPERDLALAEARRLLDEAALFIPLAQPVRWSLVARDLDGWQENGRAAHPLDQLRR